MKKKILVLWVSLVATLNVTSQVVHTNFQDVSPSPQAYAFAQYAEMPVSLFTGTPSISIPLFTIETGAYSFPISLSYHASGIKVSQEASWVGLGWNLNVGGSISRSVRGRDDFVGGYFDQNVTIPKEMDEERGDADIIAYQSLDRWSAQPYIKVDAEPDVFYYNFMGYSGKFYCKSNGENLASGNGFYLVNPDDNLKIEFDLGKGFKITTPDGTVGIFTASEMSLIYGVSFDESRGEVKNPIHIPYSIYSPEITTNWELDKIVFPNKEEITFEYSSIKYPFRPVISTTEYYYNPVKRFTKQGWEDIPEKCSTSYQANITVGQCFLTGVRWKSGYMRFETSERRDFCSLYDVNEPGLCPKLDKVLIYRNGESAPFREFIFHESYFANPEEPEDHDNLRLKLDSLSICANTVRDVYKFNYDIRHPLPPKYCFAQDLWGYYNGRRNAMFYPSVKLRGDHFYGDDNHSVLVYKKGQILSGADRTPSAEYITSGMLISMESPEGAVTTFTYEPNEGVVETQEEKVYTGKEVYRKAYNLETNEYMVHLPQNGYIELNYRYNGNVSDPKLDKYKNELISLESVNGTVLRKFGIEDFFDLANYNYSIKETIECPAGDYKLTLRSSNYLAQQAELLFYVSREKRLSAYGGGVRVAKITSPISTREFIYTNDTGAESSGILIRKPFYYASQSSYVFHDALNTHLMIGYDYYLVQQSSSVYPLESPMSNTAIGYSKVRTITRSSERTVTEDFYYAASEEKVNPAHAGMPGEYIYMNGKLLQHNVYLGEKLHQVTSNVYEELVIDSLNAWYQDSYDLGAILPYRVPITHCRLKTSTVDTYDSESETVNHSVTSYEYNTKNYMPSVVSLQNGIDKRVTETTYPVDLRNTTVFDGMCGSNMVATPVEVRTYENGVLSKKELHLYKKHSGNGSYIPSMDYSYYYGSSKPATNFNGSNVSQYGLPDITYSEYDDFNNRLEVKTRTGQSAVYLWGYNKQYPIAQIFNATLAEVKAAGIADPNTFASGIAPTASDWNRLHDLRKLLPQASVSIFQYDPLVGVIVVTDPRGMNTYYEYDAMGRLSVERDNDRHIIKTYHYTLKNER